MHLNDLKPNFGAKKTKRRPGRGIGSGLGKTGGRGHKGITSRSGGGVKAGFEGGQMPLQRRLPKFGFSSRVGRVTTEVCLSELAELDDVNVTHDTLMSAGIIRKDMKRAKLILSGAVTRAYKVTGVATTKGAREAIEAAGGLVDQ